MASLSALSVSEFKGVYLSARSPVSRTARATRSLVTAQRVEINVPKPLGVTLGSRAEGGVYVKAASGNAAAAGLKSGDIVVYTSSFFGDELWPADNLGFVNSAIKACPNDVWFEVARNETNVTTKRLPKKPAPKRFGRKMSATQAALATHICVDCGYIYTNKVPFDTLPPSYECPQCGAPKSRFSPYDPETGKAKAGAVGTPAIAAGVGIFALVVGGALAFFGLSN